MLNFTDLTGAIHIHTRYSDGSDSMETVIDAAKQAKLDFVVVTDHNNLKARKLGWEGWHDNVLVLAGCEISPTRSGHCVALNINEFERLNKMPPEKYLECVKMQGGIAFVAHPEGNVKPSFALHLAEWPCWDNPNYTGMEIWSYMHDWIGGCGWRNIRSYLKNPDAHVNGPPPGVLELWDKLAQTRRMVGIGALDNHAAHLPFRKLRWHFLKIFPHEFCFKTVRTHVMMPSVTRTNNHDIRTLLQALTHGRCYVDYLPLGDGRGFRFAAERDGEMFSLGDEVPAGAPLKFKVRSPIPAEITLLRNGLAEAAADGTELDYESAEGVTGVYRVEARIKGRPWLFTNHIYVR